MLLTPSAPVGFHWECESPDVEIPESVNTIHVWHAGPEILLPQPGAKTIVDGTRPLTLSL